VLRCGITAGESEISKGDAGFVKKTILAAREMVLLIEAGKVSFGEWVKVKSVLKRHLFF
jgi:hypothetical protein